MTLKLPDGLSPDSVDALTDLSVILYRLRPPTTKTTDKPPATISPASLKELQVATDTLKHKLQRARVMLQTLPDAARTLEQQEAEIAELEKRRKKQLDQLRRIKEDGELLAAGEQRRRDMGESAAI